MLAKQCDDRPFGGIGAVLAAPGRRMYARAGARLRGAIGVGAGKRGALSGNTSNTKKKTGVTARTGMNTGRNTSNTSNTRKIVFPFGFSVCPYGVPSSASRQWPFRITFLFGVALGDSVLLNERYAIHWYWHCSLLHSKKTSLMEMVSCFTVRTVGTESQFGQGMVTMSWQTIFLPLALSEIAAPSRRFARWAPFQRQSSSAPRAASWFWTPPSRRYRCARTEGLGTDTRTLSPGQIGVPPCENVAVPHNEGRAGKLFSTLTAPLVMRPLGQEGGLFPLARKPWLFAFRGA